MTWRPIRRKSTISAAACRRPSSPAWPRAPSPGIRCCRWPSATGAPTAASTTSARNRRRVPADKPRSRRPPPPPGPPAPACNSAPCRRSPPRSRGDGQSPQLVVLRAEAVGRQTGAVRIALLGHLQVPISERGVLELEVLAIGLRAAAVRGASDPGLARAAIAGGHPHVRDAAAARQRHQTLLAVGRGGDPIAVGADRRELPQLVVLAVVRPLLGQRAVLIPVDHLAAVNVPDAVLGRRIERRLEIATAPHLASVRITLRRRIPIGLVVGAGHAGAAAVAGAVAQPA